MSDGDVVLEALHCTIAIRRASPRVIVLEIRGHDVGELADRPHRALDALLPARGGELYIDARHAQGPSMGVSASWAQWLGSRRDRLQGVSMLTRTRFVEITADFVKRFAELGDAMRIYTDPVAFEAALARAVTS
jgi:hypothetical protein